MKLSDLISGLEHIRKMHGDLPVLEERLVFYEATEYFPDGINIDAAVKDVASYHTADNKHHYEEDGCVGNNVKDRRQFKAFVLGLGRAS